MAAALTASTEAQEIRFTVDHKSASVGLAGSAGGTLSAGTILVPAAGAPALGPLAVPVVRFDHAALGLSGVSPDVDALSHGRDPRFDASVSFAPGKILVSVDRRSHARPLPVSGPTVRSETSPFADREACQDVFVNLDAVLGLSTAASFGRHVGALDGDGLASTTSGYAYPGLGLLEGGPRDNLDGLDVVDAGATRVFFSLHPGSASAHGVAGGDVLLAEATSAFPSFAVYASAAQLGLDRVPGQEQGSDDLDALLVWDDGDGIFEPLANGWQGWGAEDGNDRLLFSISRDSALVGVADGRLGIPISPGDILMPPPATGGYPGIFIRAEQLGLRSGRPDPRTKGHDDINALDILAASAAPLLDCNGNGVEDAVDIGSGAEADVDMDGIPDGCALPDPVVYCTAAKNACGTRLAIGAVGVPSAASSSGFDVQVTAVEAGSTGLLMFSTSGSAAIAMSYGTLCVASPSKTMLVSDWTGSAGACDGLLSIDMNAYAAGELGGSPPALLGVAGTTVYAQFLVLPPKGAGLLSDAVEYVVGP